MGAREREREGAIEGERGKEREREAKRVGEEGPGREVLRSSI